MFGQPPDTASVSFEGWRSTAPRRGNEVGRLEDVQVRGAAQPSDVEVLAN
jgi:hypothetical protein